MVSVFCQIWGNMLVIKENVNVRSNITQVFTHFKSNSNKRFTEIWINKNKSQNDFYTLFNQSLLTLNNDKLLFLQMLFWYFVEYKLMLVYIVYTFIWTQLPKTFPATYYKKCPSNYCHRQLAWQIMWIIPFIADSLKTMENEIK